MNIGSMLQELEQERVKCVTDDEQVAFTKAIEIVKKHCGIQVIETYDALIDTVFDSDTTYDNFFGWLKDIGLTLPCDITTDNRKKIVKYCLCPILQGSTTRNISYFKRAILNKEPVEILMQETHTTRNNIQIVIYDYRRYCVSRVATLSNYLENESIWADFCKGKIGIDKVSEFSIDYLMLNVRLYNLLMRRNVTTIGNLASKTIKELKLMKGFGEKSINELLEILSQYGIYLR